MVFGKADGFDPTESGPGAVTAAAKRHEVSVQTICMRRTRFGGGQPHHVRRLKELEPENARLRKLVAERDLEIEVVKEVAARNGEHAGPPATSCLRPERGLSVRRACALYSVASPSLDPAQPRHGCGAPVCGECRGSARDCA